METTQSLFDRFGGIRPMATKLGFEPNVVMAWKKTRRVPAQHQPLILARAAELGLDVTAEDVVFPFPEDREATR